MNDIVRIKTNNTFLFIIGLLSPPVYVKILSEDLSHKYHRDGVGLAGKINSTVNVSSVM